MNAKEKSITTVLRNLLLLTRDVDKSVAFFTEGLGCKLLHHSKEYAEVKDANNFRIGFKLVHSHAFCTTGYSPILNFQLKNNEDVSQTVKKLELEYGVKLDGEVQSDENFEVATVKSEDGHMVSLIKLKYDEIEDGDDISPIKQESSLDPRQQEIRRLLESLKL